MAVERMGGSGLAWFKRLTGLITATALGALVLVVMAFAAWLVALPMARTLLADERPSPPSIAWRPNASAVMHEGPAPLPGCSRTTIIGWLVPEGNWQVVAVTCRSASDAESWYGALADSGLRSTFVRPNGAIASVRWQVGNCLGVIWIPCTDACVSVASQYASVLVDEGPTVGPEVARGRAFWPWMVLLFFFFLFGQSLFRHFREESLKAPERPHHYRDMSAEAGQLMGGGWFGQFMRIGNLVIAAISLAAYEKVFKLSASTFKWVSVVVLTVFLIAYGIFVLRSRSSLARRITPFAETRRWTFLYGRALSVMGRIGVPFAVAPFILAISAPIDAIAFVLVAEWEEGPTAVVRDPTLPLAFMRDESPDLAFLFVLLAVAVFAALGRYGRSLARPRPTEIAPDTPKILFLRPFEDDFLQLDSTFFDSSLGELLIRPRRVRFLPYLDNLIAHYGQLVVVAPPWEGKASGGVGLSYGDDEWKTGVEQYLSQSLFTVLSVNSSAYPIRPGFAWELDLVGRGLSSPRLVLVIGPGPQDGFADRWAEFLEMVAPLSMFQGLSAVSVTNSTLVIALGSDGWQAYGASWRDGQSYAACLHQAVTDNWDRWAPQIGMDPARAAAIKSRLLGSHRFLPGLLPGSRHGRR